MSDAAQNGTSCQKRKTPEAGAPGSGYDYDLVTIGGGSSGVRVSRMSAQYGAKVALVELPFGLVSEKDARGGLGGTCTIRGCVPKKLMIYGSGCPEDIADARGYGWELPADSEVNWGKLIEAKNSEIKRLSDVHKQLLEKNHVQHVEGCAGVVDEHTVKVNGKKLTTKYICIAAGSRATKPPLEGADLPGVITSDEALTLPRKPERIAVIGGGYIAIEFAGIFHGYGSEVHLFIRSDLPLRGFDDDIRKHLKENLVKKGVHVHLGESAEKIEDAGDGKLLLTTDKKNTLRVDNVMFATGRKASTKGMGLEEVGVKLDEKKGQVLVDEYSKSSVDSIYAIGDVTARLMLTPAAIMEGACVAKTLFGGEPTKPDYESVPSAVFAQPPIASCGPVEHEAASKYGSIDVYMTKFKPLKHSMPTGRGDLEEGIMKMLVVSEGHQDAGRVVALHMMGQDAAEIMQGLGVAVKAGATKAHFDNTVSIHPTSAEEWCSLHDKIRTVTKKDVEDNCK